MRNPLTNNCNLLITKIKMNCYGQSLHLIFFCTTSHTQFNSHSAKMSDFILWEDLDLEELLGEFTDVENIEEENSSSGEDVASRKKVTTGKKAVPPAADKNQLYQCPLCPKTYKSISGFRGHVGKVHQRPDIRAYDNKGDFPSPASQPVPHLSNPIVPIQQETFNELYDSAFSATLDSMDQNAYHSSANSEHGSIISSIARKCKANLADFQKIFESVKGELYQVLSHARSGGSFSSNREKMMAQFHRFKAATDIHVKLADFFSDPLRHCRAFGHIFLFELFHRTLEAAVVIMKCEEEQNAEIGEISASEEEVLYYVSGYIVKSMCKKWKGKNSWDEIYSKLVTSHEECKSSSWLTRIDRGGLLKPSDNMFSLIKSMEIEIRKSVNPASMHSTAMHKNTLRESVLGSFLTQFHWNKIGGEKSQLVLEAIVGLFMTVRGVAVQKMMKRQRQKSTKCKGKAKHSLRKALQNKNTNI